MAQQSGAHGGELSNSRGQWPARGIHARRAVVNLTICTISRAHVEPPGAEQTECGDQRPFAPQAHLTSGLVTRTRGPFPGDGSDACVGVSTNYDMASRRLE